MLNIYQASEVLGVTLMHFLSKTWGAQLRPPLASAGPVVYYYFPTPAKPRPTVIGQFGGSRLIYEYTHFKFYTGNLLSIIKIKCFL